MALAGALEIQIFAEIARLRDDMNKAQSVVKSSMSNIEKSVISAKSMLGSLGVGLGVGYFASLIKGTIDAADAMNDLSHKVGVSIRELAGYKLAADQSGASIEAVAKGIKGLSTYMVEHSDLLTKAGITAKNTNGMMVQLADIFQKLPDGMEKSALATKLFGKAGMELIPMLNLGSKGLQEAMDKTTEYGKKMEEFAPKADAFNDKMSELGVTAKSFGITVANPIVDGIQKIVNALEKEFDAKPGSIIHWFRTQGRGGNIRSGQEIIDAMDKAAAAENAPAAKTGVSAAAAARALIGGDATKAAAELKQYENALQSLEQQLGKLNHQTEYEKILYQELHGSLQKLTSVHKARLLEMAKQIDEQKFLTETTEAYWKALDELDATEQKRIEHARQIIEGMQDSNDKIAFENSLIGMSAEERERLNIEYERTIKLRGIDSQLQIDGINKQFDELAALVKTRQEMNRQVSTWTELSKGAGNFFGDLVVNGKSAFDRLRSSLKSFAQELIALFAQKWILNVAAGALGSTALSASAASAGTGTLAGNILGSAAGSMIGSGTGFIAGVGNTLSGSTTMAGVTGAYSVGELGTAAGMAAPYVVAALVAAKALGIIGNGNGYAQNTAYQTYGSLTNSGFSGQSIALSRDAAGHQFGDVTPNIIANDATFIAGLKDVLIASLKAIGEQAGLDSSKTIAGLSVPLNFTYAYGATEAEMQATYIKVQQDALTEAVRQFAADAGMTVDALNAMIIARQNEAKAIAELKPRVLADAANVQTALKAVSSEVASLADAAKSAAADLVAAQDNIGAAVMSAQQKVIDLLQQSADGLRIFSKSIGDFLNTLTPSATANLGSMKAQLSATAVLAAGGDLDSQSKLITQAQAVLKVAEAGSTSRVEYLRTEAFVRSQLVTTQAKIDEQSKTTAAELLRLGVTSHSAADDLAAAQKNLDDLTLLMLATGSKTKDAGDSIASLAMAYQDAVRLNTDAQNNYAAAVAATTGLTLITSGALDGLIGSLAEYDTAQATLKASSYDLATALGTPNMSAIELATALGLAGSAAAAFVASLTETHPGAIVPTPATTRPINYAGAANSTVTRLFQDILGRAPGAEGLSYWSNALLSGKETMSTIAADLAYAATIDGRIGSDATAAAEWLAANPYATARLHDLGLPGYAIGTNYMLRDGPIYAHAGETITPRPYVDMERSAREETNALLSRLIDSNRELRAEVAQLKAPMDATAKATNETELIMEQVVFGQESVRTTAI